MWEKISDYCLDVSKYFLTAVFVTSMMQDLNDVRWMLYVTTPKKNNASILCPPIFIVILWVRNLIYTVKPLLSFGSHNK